MYLVLIEEILGPKYSVEILFLEPTSDAASETSEFFLFVNSYDFLTRLLYRRLYNNRGLRFA